jgi:hypothetical protein
MAQKNTGWNRKIESRGSNSRDRADFARLVKMTIAEVRRRRTEITGRGRRPVHDERRFCARGEEAAR